MNFFGAVWKNLVMVKNIWESGREWLAFNNKINENLTMLEGKVEDLRSREEDVNTELEGIELQRGKKRRREVENWLRNVQRKKNAVQEIKQEIEESSYFSRLRLGQVVEKHIQEAAELVEQGRFPEGLSVDIHQSRGEELLVTQLVGQTAQRNLEQIWKCLTNDDTFSIGVHGMGGVGKTTIATHIHNRIIEDTGSFDCVFWVTVSQESSIYKLQNDIAKEAQIDLSGQEDERKRAAKLFQLLRRRKKFVLILDDVWKPFPLEKVGIPLHVNGGKLLLTTRVLKVCWGMGCQEVVKVKPLSTEESWDLFLKRLGSARIPPELEDIMMTVAKECAGLPLAIITTATSMRGSDEISGWRDALNELRKPVKGMIDMEQEVFRLLKFSYDRLEDAKHQQCLLYCSLFPEDYKIPVNDLIVYWIAEGLIDGMNSRQAEFDRGNSMISRLIDACLLERTRNMRGESCVKMHDVIRDMAITMTRANPMFMVKAGLQLRVLPRKSEWSENLERVSLMNNSLAGRFFCFSPNCPILKTLLMQHNYRLYELPREFFVHMQSLNVLDMRWLDLVYLPDSITNLRNLRVFLLGYCRRLKYVPSLANLANLQELDLSFTKLENVPRGMERLVNLKLLDLSDTQKLKLLPSGMLQKFSNLQCCRLRNLNLDVQLKDLIGVRRLETLAITFSRVDKLNLYVRSRHWQGLRLYCLQIGEGPHAPDKLDSRIVIIDNSSSIGQGHELFLPENMKELTITRVHKLTCLLDLLPALNDAKDLETLRIDSSHGIESIWSTITIEEDCQRCTRATSFLSNLKVLFIRNLPKLRSFFDSAGSQLRQPENRAFANLQQLTIRDCAELKHLFTSALVQHYLQNLVQISLARCFKLEDVITREERDQSPDATSSNNSQIVALPKLQNVELINLPKLNYICEGTMICHSVQEIVVDHCPRLKRLPVTMLLLNNQISTPHLSRICGEKKWWDSLEWDHPATKSVLEHVFKETQFRKPRQYQQETFGYSVAFNRVLRKRLY